ncbi:MAG: IPT/TIG domain-containing protein [Bryobacteraceae bacterium]|jgi:uncharacterized protein (TIGR03437 family)
MRQINCICGAILIGIMLPAFGVGQGYTASIVAGGGSGNCDNIPATQALVVPGGVAIDAAGNLYITQYVGGTDLVCKVSPNGIITTFAGNAQNFAGFSGDGGPATSAQLNFGQLPFPDGLAADSHGNVYIADTGNNRVRKVDPSGTITTVAGGGSEFTPMDGDGGLATAAYLFIPDAVALDSAGNLYIADNQSVRKVDSSGIISTVAGCNLANTSCVFQDIPTGSIGDGGPATSAYLQAVGVAVDRAGNLFIADSVNNRIRKVSGGIITTVAGSASGNYQGDGGTATSAGLNMPNGVAVDSAGNIYIADSGDYRIRMVNSGGTISTIAGNGAQGQYGTTSANNVPATSISLGPTRGVAIGPGGALYVADVNFGVWLLSTGTQTGGPAPSIKGVVSASAFGSFSAVAPGSYIEIYGQNLASDTRGWAGSDFNGVNAPTSLDGTSVTIGGQPAYVAYISPGQVNVQAPSNIGTGQQQLTVKTSVSTSSYMVTVNTTEPGLLAPSSFNIGGQQYVVAQFPDGAFALPPGSIAGVNSRRAQPGDTLTLYGVGFGSVTPFISAGQIAEQTSMLTSTLQVNFGSAPASVTYDGLAPSLVGLYQINVLVPNIPSSDAVPLTFTLNGVTGTQTLYTSVEE